ncbi:glycosyl transferase [Pedobacter sp. GR22-6]|uniref:glycosyl transferase n=1 Tax=Pedobacter sp. GR22-6 TaxID=3127957 RepID=UPI00307ED27B
MLKFCTLFNSAYLSRGLAMYNSLLLHNEDFHLYILAFDSDCFFALSKLKLAHATIISLDEFENEDLLRVKAGRTAAEYCWTCASSSIKYCMETYSLDHCSYIDADMLFFSDPKVLYKEMEDAGKSVMITRHRYTPQFDQSETSGIYCVQYMTFKNNEAGMAVLNWWVDACMDWCYARFEDGKFGDQKYLDDWTSRFNCVHELEHLGGGVAPWNVQQYAFSRKDGQVTGRELATGQSFDLVFYHYHAFKYAWNNTFRLTDEQYTLTRSQVKQLYKPYVYALATSEDQIAERASDIASYKRSEEGVFISERLGRLLVFYLMGFYKKFYAKRFFSCGIFN